MEINIDNQYCESLTRYQRRKSRIVNIGDIPLGGTHPIRVQSMTTTDTMDTKATVEQSIRMIDAGSEYVRITAPSIKEAKNLSEIKKELRKRGYETPLIADIHFTPNAAIEAARIVEKVRINPGNFADRKKFEHIEYTDQSYNAELERIHDRFVPLVKICKEEGTAMRIGSNHGSLSDRILSRYGDTPMGMVESALEFIRICEIYKYYDIVLSMKASNTRVMVQAYRLLVKCMDGEGMNYPLHLGVTEAGEGEDGRMKSALGIGALMEDGLGDTIRVSLTEEPENEMPVANALVRRYDERSNHDFIREINENILSPFEYKKRKTKTVMNIGGDNVPRVVADLSSDEGISTDTLTDLGYKYMSIDDKWEISDFACDYVFVKNNSINFSLPGTLGVIQDYSTWVNGKKNQHYPLFTSNQYLLDGKRHPDLNFIHMTLQDMTDDIIEKLKNDFSAVLFIDTYNKHGMPEQRRIFMECMLSKCMSPIIVGRTYKDMDMELIQIHGATDIGSLMVDGLGDGIFLSANNSENRKQMNETAFGILQASRTRISKTEYISCPSCGRTLFDLQETTAKVRERTSHLKGLKIGIMGCIVNGPGEMADADYGYVGIGVGKVSLYRGQEVVMPNVPTNVAVDALIDLIREDGLWVEHDELAESYA